MTLRELLSTVGIKEGQSVWPEAVDATLAFVVCNQSGLPYGVLHASEIYKNSVGLAMKVRPPTPPESPSPDL